MDPARRQVLLVDSSYPFRRRTEPPKKAVEKKALASEKEKEQAQAVE